MINQTKDICKVAIKYGIELDEIKNKTDELWKYAIECERAKKMRMEHMKKLIKYETGTYVNEFRYINKEINKRYLFINFTKCRNLWHK
jgi:hypothetical protein